MTEKITPGPWRTGSGRDKDEIRGIHGVLVGRCYRSGVYGADGSYTIGAREAERNARLIAAAPEMLEALLYIARYPESNTDYREVIPAAEKATGKTWDEIRRMSGCEYLSWTQSERGSTPRRSRGGNR